MGNRFHIFYNLPKEFPLHRTALQEVATDGVRLAKARPTNPGVASILGSRQPWAHACHSIFCALDPLRTQGEVRISFSHPSVWFAGNSPPAHL